MVEVTGNLWEYYDAGYWVAVPTNCSFVNDRAIMGAGIALDAAKRFPYLPTQLAKRLRRNPRDVHAFLDWRVLAVPTKYRPEDSSTVLFVAESVVRLVKLVDQTGIQRVYLPELGCGLGGLTWAEVEPVMRDLDPRFVVVHYGG